MGRVYLFLPIYYPQAMSRCTEFDVVCQTLAASVRRALNKIERIIFHIHLNGVSMMAKDMDEFRLVILMLRTMAQHWFGGALITWSSVAGKIAALNYGLQEARRQGFTRFFCIDNDILIPRDAIGKLLELSFVSPQYSAVTATKAPLITANSTYFQREYSYAIQMSFEYDIYPKRPTGSLYCINPERVGEFPQDCNEGDYLDRHHGICSDVIVLSAFPAKLGDEVRRRRRLHKASKALKYNRVHHDMQFIDDIDRRLRLPDKLDKNRYRRSLKLYKKVIMLAIGEP